MKNKILKGSLAFVVLTSTQVGTGELLMRTLGVNIHQKVASAAEGSIENIKVNSVSIKPTNGTSTIAWNSDPKVSDSNVTIKVEMALSDNVKADDTYTIFPYVPTHTKDGSPYNMRLIDTYMIDSDITLSIC